jgi:hypothetical protein
VAVTPDGTDPRLLAYYVLRHFGEADCPTPGSFYGHLLDTITRADRLNRARLALGFPMLVLMVNVAQDEPDGMERLRQIAKGDEPPPSGR